MTSVPLLASLPVAGGLDVDLPGRGLRLRATRWPGAGTPVLLLHGLASTRRFWDLVVPRLAGLPLVALDQRGHGDSDRPDGPYDGATVAHDALIALDALGLSRAVVVGHSWGAWTALRLAAEAPERVLAVVAIDGGLGWMREVVPDSDDLRARLTPPCTELHLDELRAQLRNGPLAPWWSPAVEAAVLPLFAVGRDGLARPRLDVAHHMAIVEDLITADPEQWLLRITCPTWLVDCSPADPPRGVDVAAATAVKRAAYDRAESQLAHPRVLHWHGAVHDVPLQWPALVAGVVRAAVEDAAGVPSGPAGEGGQA